MSISNEQVVSFLKKNPIGIVCALVSIVAAGLIYYRSDLLPAAHAIVDQKSQEGERLALNVKYANQLKEQLNELLAAGQTVDSRMIFASQLANNLEYFYKIEAETNTRLLSLNQVTNPAKIGVVKTAFIPIAFTINVQGSYIQVLDFLHRLENGLHFCRIVSSTVAKAAPEGDLLTLNLNIEILGQR